MTSLSRDLIEVRRLLSRKDCGKYATLMCLMLSAAFVEAIGIGIIPLYMSVLLNPSSLADIRWIGHYFSGLPNEPTVQLILSASLVLMTYIILKNCYIAFVYYIQVRTVYNTRIKLCNSVFHAYQHAPYEWFLQRNSSELIRNIRGDTAQIVGGVMLPMLDLIMASFMGLFILIVILLSTPALTFISLSIIAGGVYLVVHRFQGKLHHTGSVLRTENKEMLQAVLQAFGAFIDSRIIGCEEYLAKIFNDSMVRSAKAMIQRALITKATPLAVETISIFGIVSLLFIILQVSSSLTDALPAIILVVVAVVRLKQVIGRAATAFNHITAARASIPGIVSDLHELKEIDSRFSAKLSLNHKIKGFANLSLCQVTYSYPGTEMPSAREINLEIRKGESVAFVGPTGCGKTTLANILLGLLEPQIGCVTVNGVDIFSDLNGWRANLGYIPQSVFLIDNDIRSNIAFGVDDKEINEERFQEAIHGACLNDFIDTLPEGIHTVVGERGVRLSGGQRQRLGIARALYVDPEVLVMDEATSALDNTTESEIMEVVNRVKNNRTLIMIAHRLSTVKDCNCLYFMKDGRIDALGTYDELYESHHEFRMMTR